MPKISDIINSAKETAQRIAERIEKKMDKVEDQVNCEAHKDTYKNIARLNSLECNKSTVSNLLSLKEKIKNLTSEELLLKHKGSPDANDCSWFKSETNYYLNVKLTECGIQKPIVSSFKPTDCQVNVQTYKDIASLVGHCDKVNVLNLIQSVEKLGISSPDVVLFAQDLKTDSYNLNSRDCAWFNDQVEMYNAKLVECGEAPHLATEL